MTHLWHKSIRETLNAGQQAALERAYQSRFHIIQGPPGEGTASGIASVNGLLQRHMHQLTYFFISLNYTISPHLPSHPFPSPPLPLLTGTEKLVVAVHLAYAFAQKNRRLGVRKATGLQHCVLLCAPDDTAVDTTLRELVACGYGMWLSRYLHVCKV